MHALALERPASIVDRVSIQTARPDFRQVARLVPSTVDRNTRQLCMSLGLDLGMSGLLDKLPTMRIRLVKGATLFRAGDRFTALYAIRSGSCKTVLLSEGGKSQISGYHMPGDLLGIGAIGLERHECDAIALEDTEVTSVPFDAIENMNVDNRQFHQHFLALMAREISRSHALALMLGTMRAEQRLAAFFLDLSQRYKTLGFSSCEFVLRMTREEIGSYLGLKLETVSRLCTRFQQEGMIQVQGRAIKLLDLMTLRELLSVEA